MKLVTIELDHAAIASNDIAQLKRVFLLLGLIDGGSEAVPSQGVQTHFLKTPQQQQVPQVELLEVLKRPGDDQGTVAQYLAKKGAGIHHLSFRVSDIVALSEHLTANQIKLVYTEPQPGAHQSLVNFIHPKSAGGILIELAQKAGK